MPAWENVLTPHAILCQPIRAAALLSAFATLVLRPSAAEAQADRFAAPYREHCAVCHGANLEGAAQGTPLVGVDLRHGNSRDAIRQVITEGVSGTAMPAWEQTLSEVEIERLAIFIAEQRAALGYSDFRVEAPPVVPDGVVQTELHAFRVETVAEGLDPLPYSIAPLPDGRILVTEKPNGLRIISPDGRVSEPIRGTPSGFNDGMRAPGILVVYSNGSVLDVALHPNYAENGWIYLTHTERCNDCNAVSRQTGNPVSMLRLLRGRIRDGAWVDEEVIWRTDLEHYTSATDLAIGGRITFDGAGHVFFTVGVKGDTEWAGVQDLSIPWGKVHRVRDDGGIPPDNPFVGTPGALPTIWTYGHRSPQGLEFDRVTGRLWGTEMGQRGGDEVNLLRPGRNYGWPLHSLGLTYQGTPVAFGAELGIEVDLDRIELPVVDLTPSPAVSSITFYDGDAFPRWRRNLLVGSLKATELYRMVVEGDQVTHRETLLDGLGRIRDVEVGPDGNVYLLLEHITGGRVLRLVAAG